MAADASPQSYTQNLLARFSLPSARWSGGAGVAGADFFNLLASAVSAATGTGAGSGGGSEEDETRKLSASGTLIPPTIRDSSAKTKMSFIAAQRERLNIVLSALDREATQIATDEEEQRREREARRALSISLDGGGDEDAEDEPTQRLPSGVSAFSVLSGLSKSRSEADFEKIEAESGAEDTSSRDTVRRRSPAANAGGSWLPWGWGSGGGDPDTGSSTAFEK